MHFELCLLLRKPVKYVKPVISTMMNTALSENLSLQNIMNTFEEKLLMARMETAVHYITEFEYLLDRIDTEEKKADAPAAYKTKEEKSEHGKSHISGIFRAYFLHI